jgi:hypothetical protein
MHKTKTTKIKSIQPPPNNSKQMFRVMGKNSSYTNAELSDADEINSEEEEEDVVMNTTSTTTHGTPRVERIHAQFFDMNELNTMVRLALPGFRAVRNGPRINNNRHQQCPMQE